MTLAHGTYNTVQVNTVIVPAQPGKIIRVARLVVTTWASLKVMLLSDPAGEHTIIAPPLHVSTSGLCLQFGRGYALTTARGKALGFTASFQLTGAEYSIAVWYEAAS